ncbi:hypothetical protein PUR21_15580 [Methylorubrum rhodesianum]|uniref:Uncharacterized protein n=1 Tax=Methylorubrum rhodesianum TaxID=29427 RepID=A0ABU9ZDH2_9HYPH
MRAAKLTGAPAAIPARGRPAATTTVPAARTALLGAVTVGDAVEVPAARHAGMVRVVGTRPRR